MHIYNHKGSPKGKSLDVPWKCILNHWEIPKAILWEISVKVNNICNLTITNNVKICKLVTIKYEMKQIFDVMFPNRVDPSQVIWLKKGLFMNIARTPWVHASYVWLHGFVSKSRTTHIMRRQSRIAPSNATKFRVRSIAADGLFSFQPTIHHHRRTEWQCQHLQAIHQSSTYQNLRR